MNAAVSGAHGGMEICRLAGFRPQLLDSRAIRSNDLGAATGFERIHPSCASAC
jgi:hypothetical protein